MILPGYAIRDEVFRGRRRVVLRGERLGDGRAVLIKTAADEFPTPAMVAGLRREFEILGSLRVEGVVRPLDLLDWDGRPALVLEDPGGIALARWIASGPVDLATFFWLATRLSATLSVIHGHGIIHKDLQPGHILVDREAGRVTLLDFGIAARLDVEHQPLQPPNLLEGTIPYMSPEQTGRMNRDLDYRSDLYSLGVTLYEALTGRLPFDSLDPLEVIHGHIAQQPPPPAGLVPGLPATVSDLLLKLLAKAPEERYQSGRGLHADLVRCEAEWLSGRGISDTPLGRADVPERFVIPQRLYGRETEVGALQDAFTRVGTGRAELLLVTGHSGIGKTSLIQELHKSLPKQRGLFTSGKFDQQARDVPYAALVQAFRGLTRQLLGESDEQVRAWGGCLREALGPNARVVVDVIPELEHIIGRPPPVPVLDPHDAQNRFNLAFQRLVGALAGPGHPLVVFLDDLQWADAGTLSLLPSFLAPDLAGLLLIGAYRDNEVLASHPLRLALDDLGLAGAPVRELRLPPLGAEPLGQFIADTLRAAPERAGPAAAIILGKTGGNPFFVTQILRSLHQDGMITFDPGSGEWVADLDGIRRTAVTDNVVDLMTARIQRLAPPAQMILRLASCVGGRFDLRTLAVISQRSPAEAAAHLTEALERGLVLPIERSYGYAPDLVTGLDPAAVRYRFLHDRVQQAAYDQIPEAARREAHLTIGRLLLAHAGEAARPESLFEIVNHLNYGAGLIDQPAERRRLADLNLAAGRRSRASTAYHSAHAYFTAGRALLGDDALEEDHALALALHLEQAEAAYLCGRFAEAEAGLTAVRPRCRTDQEHTDVSALLITLFETLSRYDDAVATSLGGLLHLGVAIPAEPDAWPRALADDLEAIQRLIGDRPIASLRDASKLDDARIRQAMRLLQATWAPAYISGHTRLGDLVAARLVRLSLEHGISEPSAFGFLHHAITVGSVLGEYERAAELGALALAINDRFADLRLRAVVHHRYAALVNPWRQSFADCVHHAREAVRAALESGNLHVAGYAQFQQAWYGMHIERDLDSFRAHHLPTVDTLERIGLHTYADMQRAMLQWGAALQGRTSDPTELTGADFDEEHYCTTVGRGGIFRALHATIRLELLQSFGRIAEARRFAGEEAEAVQAFVGSIWPAMFAFRHVLALCAWYPTAPPEEREAEDATLDAQVARLARWARSAPQNFGHLHLLAAAEVARVRGDAGAAVQGYEAALDAVASQESPRHRALVNELYGAFWLGRQRRAVAAVFLAEARFGYATWGATAKLADLDARYGDLAGEDRARVAAAGPAGLRETTETLPSALDAVAVARAARVISGEIDLERLLERLLRVALESAGADRGALLLEHDGGAAVWVEGTAADIRVRMDAPVPLGEADLPVSVVNFVRHSGESVVLDDAMADPDYRDDAYITRAGPRSILCTPVLNLGRALAVLYLENRLTAHAFTTERVQLMEILSAQAAIAIQNARLFTEVNHLRDRLQAENVYLQEEIKVHHGFEDIVGRSPALRKVLEQVEQVAPTDASVLITGETGTGKELIAHAIHSLSRRRDKALVTLNCGAVAPGLIESELFGHEKGAFTGALARKIGRFELADGGTILLDEIGDLPPELQVKLLRVLQEGEFQRVGSARTQHADVRVIAATHRDLARAAEEGRFRADLYYRLNVFPITSPPLRERREDIPLLVQYYVTHFGAKLGKRIETIPRNTMETLVNYPWPGNIRELRNVIERSLIVSRGPALELAQWLPQPAAAPEGASLSTLADQERQHILAALQRTGWRVSGRSGAAELLGLKPTTLEARMKKLGIRRPKSVPTNIS